MRRHRKKNRWARGSWHSHGPGVRSRGKSRRDGDKYMSSLNPVHTPTCRVGGKRTLQRLRRQAGFRSAKDFAEALGIPSSTYARYERAGDGTDCGIPLPAAWQIADKLGCSIDLVVGREDIDAPRPCESMEDRINSLSRTGVEMLDDYLRFLVHRDDADTSQDWR